MPDLNIRDVDPELLKRLKTEAVERGVTLKELAVEKLSAAGPKEGVEIHHRVPYVSRDRKVRSDEGRESVPDKPLAATRCSYCRHGKSAHRGTLGCCTETGCNCGGWR
jgi:hypothetical protein